MKTDFSLSRDDLARAVAQGILDRAQADQLIAYLEANGRPADPQDAMPPKARFDLTHLLWYAGTLIIMGAMGLFTTLAFSQMGGGALVITGLVYGIGLTWAGHRLWQNDATRLPGGLLIAAAIAMVPMIIFGFQELYGWWGGFEKPGTLRGFYIWIKGGWLPMEIATIVAAGIALRFYPFAFIAFPAALCLWFLSMDISEWIVRSNLVDTANFSSWELRRKVSLVFGLALLVATWAFELKKRPADYAFWLHLIAAMTFWGGLTFQNSDSEIGKALYCLINVGLLGLAVFLRRRVYAVFGVIGVMVYLGHLAEKVFKDSLLFPFALSLIGLAVIGLGLYYARNRVAISAWLEQRIPAGLKALQPASARADA